MSKSLSLFDTGIIIKQISIVAYKIVQSIHNCAALVRVRKGCSKEPLSLSSPLSDTYNPLTTPCSTSTSAINSITVNVDDTKRLFSFCYKARKETVCFEVFTHEKTSSTYLAIKYHYASLMCKLCSEGELNI